MDASNFGEDFRYKHRRENHNLERLRAGEALVGSSIEWSLVFSDLLSDRLQGRVYQPDDYTVQIEAYGSDKMLRRFTSVTMALEEASFYNPQLTRYIEGVNFHTLNQVDTMSWLHLLQPENKRFPHRSSTKTCFTIDTHSEDPTFSCLTSSSGRYRGFAFIQITA